MRHRGATMRVLQVALAGMVLLMMGSGGAVGGQMTQTPIAQNPSVPSGADHGAGLGDIPNSPHLEEQQARARNNERQQKLVADTNKLLALATDLKTQVDKTDKGIMSVDVIKKADEIEKLAHSVKERMKG